MAVPSPPPRGIGRRICLTRAVRAQLAENEAAVRAVKTNKETEGSLLAHRRKGRRFARTNTVCDSATGIPYL